MVGNWMISMGLDLGTSTTKLIVSRLRLESTVGVSALPRVEIVERELVYKSPIYPTPLQGELDIDMEAIRLMLQREYQTANVSLAEVRAGAVIITGEAATKRNAEQVVHYLAERAGDFVVATAGADLEGIWAGKGSGAAARSLQEIGVIANVDIGGGTANVAFFENGKPAGTITYHVGGRLLRLQATGTVEYVSDAIQPWLVANGFALEPGMRISYPTLAELACCICESFVSHLLGASQHHGELLVLAGAGCERTSFTELIVSGGIGSLLEEAAPQTIQEVTKFGDFGPLLASMLRQVLYEHKIKACRAQEAGRATVMGAGMQSTEISGATIHAPLAHLPLRNVLVIEVEFGGEECSSEEQVENLLSEAVKRGLAFGQDPRAPLAFSLANLPDLSYQALQRLVDPMAAQFRERLSERSCLVVLCDRDVAKAFGQALYLRCRGYPEILCIDQVSARTGDYIDLGTPVAGEAIPVTVKTLVFSTGHGRGGKG